ncbi:MAG: hypothetical protein HFJ66_05830 [Eggerthellaceae bacterium]|nr:hypothetical protein [Eggerthellaceae bacterium]
MSDFEAFTIDDDFDPLAPLGFDGEEGPDDYSDYMPPIPDAQFSRVPEPVPVSPEERIEKLLQGLPGQRFRVLHLAQLAREEPLTMEAMVAGLDDAYPQRASVFSAAQLVELLEKAGGLEVAGRLDEAGNVVPVSEPAAAPAPDELTDEELEALLADGDNRLAVEEAPALVYLATPAGTLVHDQYVNLGNIEALVAKEPRYDEVYRTIFGLVTAEGGATMKELDAAVNGFEVMQEPKRFCGYFLDRLEKAGAVEYRDIWQATPLGHQFATTL